MKHLHRAQTSEPFLLAIGRIRQLNKRPEIDLLLLRAEHEMEAFMDMLTIGELPGNANQVVVDTRKSLIHITTIDDVLHTVAARGHDAPFLEELATFRTMFEKIADEVERPRADGRPGPLCERLRDVIPHMEQELRGARAQGLVDDMATLLYQIGWGCDELGWHARALRCHREAAHIHEATGDTKARATNFHMMGVAYRKLGRNDDAIRVLNEAMQVTTALGDRGSWAMSLAEMASVLEVLGRFDEALHGFESALPVFQRLRDAENTSLCHEAIIRVGRLSGATNDMNAHEE